MNITKHKYAFAALAVVAMPVIGVAAWVPTADSTTSAPKFTDGNFVISWNTNNKQLTYESHDASVSTVCDMSTLSEDVDAVAGYSHPTKVAVSGFASKSGITRVILPEACYGINEKSFSSMADLESVVISSQTKISGKQSFSGNKKLSTITPHGVAETNGVVFLPETVTAIPANCFQSPKSTALKHVIALGATDFGGDAGFQECNGLETVTMNDIKHLYTLAFQSCYALTNVVALSRDNPFSGIVSISGSYQFQSCSSWTQPIDFSAATFSSLQTQMFYGAKKVPEFRLPATLTSFNKQAGAPLRRLRALRSAPHLVLRAAAVLHVLGVERPGLPLVHADEQAPADRLRSGEIRRRVEDRALEPRNVDRDHGHGPLAGRLSDETRGCEGQGGWFEVRPRACEGEGIRRSGPFDRRLQGQPLLHRSVARGRAWNDHCGEIVSQA